MKVFISADIEGITGISHWSQADKKDTAYAPLARRMGEEVQAAIKGAKAAGATEIVLRDAHGSAENMDVERIDEDVRFIQRFNGHPDHMMYGIDESFDAAMMIGYHAAGGIGGNPLAHTLSSRRVHKLYINDDIASEFLVNALIAAEKGVPTVLVSGDETLRDHALEHQPSLTFVPTFKAEGAGVSFYHPKRSLREIEKKARAALENPPSPLKRPRRYTITVEYTSHLDAYAYGFYPGAKQIDAHTVQFQSKHFDDIKTFLVFCV